MTLPRAFGPVHANLALRSQVQDFVVIEDLGLEPSGEGEHLWLWIEKQGLDTAWAVKQLAKHLSVAVRQISWSGRKDRHAICRQWLSVHLPGQSLALPEQWPEGIKVLAAHRHHRKLRVGTHKGNFFQIHLRGTAEDLRPRWQTLVEQGVPNWFGEQRFGHAGGNLAKAEQWFQGQYRPARHERDLLLSAARSFLFNQLLSLRVEEGSWNQLLAGEICLLGDGRSAFLHEADEPTQAQDNLSRCQQGMIQPSLPLFGRSGSLQPQAEAQRLEDRLQEQWPVLCQGLLAQGLESARRPCRVYPQQCQFEQDEQGVRLAFRLPKGSFATALIYELCDYELQSTEYPTE